MSIQNFPSYNQQNYPDQLGTGNLVTIAMYGCAVTALASVCKYFMKPTDPRQINSDLIRLGGYASNGSGGFTLVIWSAVTRIYPDIATILYENYPSIPADMERLDSILSDGYPVVVGVSFTHKPTDTKPSHYLVIYRKNTDGTYQMMDPWTGEDSVYDHKYAVNGMSVANSILQAIAYAGPIPSPQVAASQQVQADTLAVLRSDFERMRTKCDAYDPMAAAGYAHLSDIDEKLSHLTADNQVVRAEYERQVKSLQDENDGLKRQIKQVNDSVGRLADELKRKSEEDSTAIDAGLTAQSQLTNLSHEYSAIANALKSKAEINSMLMAVDDLYSKLDKANKQRQTIIRDSITQVREKAHGVRDFFGNFGIKW